MLAQADPATPRRSPPGPEIRTAVRDLLLATEAYHALPEPERQRAAQALVRLCDAAVSLAREEEASDSEIAARRPLAQAQATAPLLLAAHGLTARESDVARLVLRGLSTTAIAARIPAAKKGTVEIRPVIDIPELPN